MSLIRRINYIRTICNHKIREKSQLRTKKRYRRSWNTGKVSFLTQKMFFFKIFFQQLKKIFIGLSISKLPLFSGFKFLKFGSLRIQDK